MNHYNESRDRYPGIMPFWQKDADLFTGREDVIQQLIMLITLEPLVVLCGRTGTGKTSFVNAALNGQRFSDWKKIYFRLFQPIREGPDDLFRYLDIENNEITLEFDKHIQQAGLDTQDTWIKFKKAELGTGGKPLLLVFDQFEEISQWPGQKIDTLKKILRNLLSEDVPMDFAKTMFEANFEHINREKAVSPLKIRILFVIRSDYLFYLNRLTDTFPGILRHCVELCNLTRDEARSALVEPAENNDPGFRSKPFKYAEDALEAIINSLTESDGLIEPVQLQFLALQIERLADRRNLPVIESFHFEEIRQSGTNFYEVQLNRLSDSGPDTQNKARHVMEELLVVESSRVVMDERTLLNYHNIPLQLLQNLEELRLIKRQRNNLGITYEVSHDSLLEPILKAKKNRILNAKLKK